MAQDSPKTKGKTWWKVFFWIYAVLTVGGVTLSFFSPETKWYEIVLEFFLYVLVITGLYGFTYNKKYFTAKSWLHILLLLILYDLSNWYIMFTQDFGGMADLSYIIIVALVLTTALLTILPYLALYRYGLKSPEIWEQEKT